MKALTLHAPPTVKERGILFSGAMVRALLAGKKTQTRRAVKPQPTLDPDREQWSWETRKGVARWTGDRPRSAALIFGFHEQCPYGQPGDRLWVRETHAPRYFDDGRPGYRADWTAPDGVPEPRWTPSLLMKRTDSRLTLAVESIRVERAQDISDADIEAEGVDAEAVQSLWEAATLKRREEAWGAKLLTPPFAGLLPHRRWQTAWTLINGRASWDANPWVWVVSFRRLPSPPGEMRFRWTETPPKESPFRTLVYAETPKETK